MTGENEQDLAHTDESPDDHRGDSNVTGFHAALHDALEAEPHRGAPSWADLHVLGEVLMRGLNRVVRPENTELAYEALAVTGRFGVSEKARVEAKREAAAKAAHEEAVAAAEAQQKAATEQPAG